MTESARPVVAVVGRPNVGKSTLVNRILGRRQAVVQDVPGVTRDRVFYDAEWSGRDFVVIDTGGWAPDAKGMAAQIAEQAELAIAAADAVVVPALAVDRFGIRLGRGGGYYDRALVHARADAVLVTVVFDDERVPELPREIHDRPVRAVVTPSGGWQELQHHA